MLSIYEYLMNKKKIWLNEAVRKFELSLLFFVEILEQVFLRCYYYVIKWLVCFTMLTWVWWSTFKMKYLPSRIFSCWLSKVKCFGWREKVWAKIIIFIINLEKSSNVFFFLSLIYYDLNGEYVLYAKCFPCCIFF